ncbi:MAG: peptidoglycan editing factor PgeF [Thermodesulfobacteriota bacterium]
MSIKALTLPTLSNAKGVFHGCFNRYGGVSQGPWESLNISTSCGDEGKMVAQNRELIARHLGLEMPPLTLQQVHGSEVIVVDQQSPAGQEGDAMLTRTPGLGLLIQQADCQAVLLFDPDCPAVANIHVGWRGNVVEIISRTVRAMTQHFASRPERLLAGISPSLGPCCAQFVNYKTEFPVSFQEFQARPHYFDLWQISRQQLLDAGLIAEHISLAQVCTCCNDDFFSYRREKITGRCGSIIGLTP